MLRNSTKDATTMPVRSGNKMRGSHTTVSEFAADVYDIITKLSEVVGISLGILQSGKGHTGGLRKVKIGDFKGGILLTIRQSRSVQEMRVFVTDSQDAKLAIARALRNNDIAISFRRD